MFYCPKPRGNHPSDCSGIPMYVSVQKAEPLRCTSGRAACSCGGVVLVISRRRELLL